METIFNQSANELQRWDKIIVNKFDKPFELGHWAQRYPISIDFYLWKPTNQYRCEASAEHEGGNAWAE